MFRVEGMPGLGWMLSRKLYKGELEAKWPNETEPLTWDGWLREGPQLQGRLEYYHTLKLEPTFSTEYLYN